MFVIGLTGGLATGKSTAAAMFAKKGWKVIDADAITGELLAKDQNCIKKVAKLFPRVILASGKIDRSELAKIVFSHPRELHKLTDILYPKALKVVKDHLSLYKKEPFVILDVPLLFESGWNKITDIVIVVKAKRNQQLVRAQQRLGLSRAQALQRMRHQMPLKEKCDMADIIIDNSRDLKNTQTQVDAIMNRLKMRKL